MELASGERATGIPGEEVVLGNALVAEVGFEPTSRALADPRMFPPTLLLRLARHRICEPLALLSKVVRVLPHFLGRGGKQSIRQL
jgi:hypothetical protein